MGVTDQINDKNWEQKAELKGLENFQIFPE